MRVSEVAGFGDEVAWLADRIITAQEREIKQMLARLKRERSAQ